MENSVVAQPAAASPEERRAVEETIDEALEATVEEAVMIEGKEGEEREEGTSGYGGTKKEGMEWLRRCQERIRGAGSVLCVGGGALGIRKSSWPSYAMLIIM